MQSRTSFLATGLVPVTETSQLPSDDCSICTDPFENPVALPCKHMFCKECVVDWLSLPRRSTCPYCRHECFTPVGPATIRREPANSARAALILQATSRSTTAEFDVFSDDISWETAGIQRATDSASRWLNDQPETVGPASIHKRYLGHDIIAMGNLIKGYARASGRPYSARELGELRISIDILYKGVETRNGTTMDALILTWELNSEVRLGLLRALGQGRPSTFIEPLGAENPSGDMHRLINYVAFRASEEDAGRRQRRQNIRDEPSLIARVGMRVRSRFDH